MLSSQSSSFWDGWTAPAELNRSTPRSARRNASGIAVTVLAVLMAGGGIALGIGLWNDSQRDAAELRLLQAEGRDAQGTITRLWQTGGRGNRHMAAYRFSVEDRAYENEISIKMSHWNDLGPGSPIAIRYLPRDPRRNFPAADPPQPMPAWVAMVAGIALAAFGAKLHFLVDRERRLLEDGHAAPGIVTANQRFGARRGSNNVVAYEFRIPEGTLCKGRADRRPIPEGSIICVLYNPGNPRRNAPYPLKLVTPDM